MIASFNCINSCQYSYRLVVLCSPSQELPDNCKPLQLMDPRQSPALFTQRQMSKRCQNQYSMYKWIQYLCMCCRYQQVFTLTCYCWDFKPVLLFKRQSNSGKRSPFLQLLDLHVALSSIMEASSQHSLPAQCAHHLQFPTATNHHVVMRCNLWRYNIY